MATHICENQSCTYHQLLQAKDAGAPYIDTMEDGERVRVERHLYRSRDGKRDFFLCDVCHAAVQMVVTPNAKVSGAGTASAGLPGYAGDKNGEK